jgi:ribonuclease HI
MHVTIYSDASFNDKTGKGGWAFYLKSPSDDFLISGPSSPDTQSSNQAEVEGMYEGLRHALQRFGSAIESVTVVGDSQSALREFEGWATAASGSDVALLKAKIASLMQQHPGVRLTCKWKKGRHKRPSGTKIASHISAICDQLAKVAMREE